MTQPFDFLEQLAAVIVLAFVVLFITVRAEPIIRYWIDRRYPTGGIAGAGEATGPMLVPEDIEAWANGWGDEWARKDAITVATQAYHRLKDWNAVRRSIGIGEMGVA